jgi:hypothetical protein
VIQTWIELHDSEVLQVQRSDVGVALLLDAYVHRWEKGKEGWQGTGWTQPVRCTIGYVAKSWKPPVLPARISNGHLHAPDSEPGNIIPLPFSYDGPVVLTLIFDTGAEFQLEGDAVRLESIGPAQYVEDLPEDMRPDIAG